MDFEAIKNAIGQGRQLVTIHAGLELDADGLDAFEVWASIQSSLAETILLTHVGQAALFLVSLGVNRSMQ